ncbi:HotDog domain-containing protein, partial [Lasiosphaeria miniovina]
PPPPAVVAEPQSPIVASKPKPKTGRAVRRLIFAATFLLVGTVAGSVLRVVVHPPDPAVPGTEKDRITTEILHKEAEKLPVFQTLSADPAWESWDAYNTLTPEHRAQHIAAGAMGGSRGVGGYQRIFYKASTGELTSVIYFGHSITGWPGVVHGGAIATILDESCGRAAFKQWGGMSGMTANLKLAYIRPTRSDNFYLVRVRPVPDDELPEEDRGKRHYKSFVDASVEEARTGNVAVVAKALFVGGSGKDGKASHGKWKGSGLDENARF